MALQQLDLFAQAEDERICSGVRTLEIVAASLPSTPLVRVSDIAVALNIKADVVYRWIDSGQFEYVDLSSGPTGKPNYRIRRASFLEFLKNRVNRI